MKRGLAIAGVLAALLGLGLYAALTQEDAAPALTFSRAQAEAGQSEYARYCASCHGADLSGIHLAPGLVGERFDRTWRGRSADVLSLHIRRMPPESLGGSVKLSEVTYTNILAHVLRSNGFPPGESDLPSAMSALRRIKIPRLEAADFDPMVPVSKSAEQAALLNRLPRITDAVLRDPPPEDWLHWGRTYEGFSYSPLDQINRNNVRNLKLAWRAPLRFGESMPMPLVHQGVLFMHTYPDTVLAMDATSGAVLWRYERKGIDHSTRKLGLSLYDDKVFAATTDLHVIALDAKTGDLVWDHAIDTRSSEEIRQRFDTRSAPLIAGNKVIQGVLGFVPKGAFLIAIDIQSGEEVWRFDTIARPGQPGGNTWNDLAPEKRSGGSVWHQGTYDPELNLVYYGIAPTYDTAPLLVPVDQEGVTNEAMYTNCTVALDAETGNLVWYYQHMPNDQWDLDWAFERQIAELPTPDDGTVKAVMNVGKIAMLDVLEAATGRFLFSIDMGVQNLVTAIDPVTGAKTIDPTKLPSPDSSSVVCPLPSGARNWPPTSYSPRTRFVYVPITESCSAMSTTGKGGWLSTGVQVSETPHPGLADGKMGRVQAIDVARRELAWNADRLTPPSTGLLATGGGLLFSGDLDPSLKAFHDTTGELLWEAPLDDAPASSLVTYSVRGKQYLAVVVGMTNIWIRELTRSYNRFASTIGTQQKSQPGQRGGAAIWVFTLDDSHAGLADRRPGLVAQ